MPFDAVNVAKKDLDFKFLRTSQAESGLDEMNKAK